MKHFSFGNTYRHTNIAPTYTQQNDGFQRAIPITYPTGIGVIPPPINLPVVPDPIPTKTPAISQDKLFHIRDKVGNKLSLDKLLQDPISNKIWFPSTENELGRLAQGFRNCVKEQDAMDFIHKHEVPTHKVVTYANFVCDNRPLKSEPFWVCMTVAGDKFSYDDETGSPTASLLEAKLLANSVISDHKKHNSKFCTIDLKDFFLNTPMAAEPEFIQIHKKYFSSEFIQTYNLTPRIASDDYVYF